MYDCDSVDNAGANDAKQPCLLSQSLVMTAARLGMRGQSRRRLSRVGHSETFTVTSVFLTRSFSFCLFFFFFSPPTATAQYNHVSSCGSELFSQYKSENRSHILIDRQSERDQT